MQYSTIVLSSFPLAASARNKDYNTPTFGERHLPVHGRGTVLESQRTDTVETVRRTWHFRQTEHN